MDGVEELTGVLVLGATNRVDILDPALLRPGRFDVHLELPAPNRNDRKEIFAIGLRDKPTSDDLNLDELADQSEGFSGAEVQAVCRRGALQVIREAISQGDQAALERPLLIRREHLAQAMAEVRSQKQLGG